MAQTCFSSMSQGRRSVRIYDADRAGMFEPKSVLEPGFGDEEAHLGYHVDFATPRANLADTLLRLQNLDAYKWHSGAEDGIKGSSIEGRVVTMKRKR
jgi:hypothetical protein